MILSFQFRNDKMANQHANVIESFTRSRIQLLCYGRKKKIENQKIVDTEPVQINDSSKSSEENHPVFVDIKHEIKIEEEENW